MTEPVNIEFRINSEQLAAQSQRAVNSVLGIGEASSRTGQSVSNMNSSLSGSASAVQILTEQVNIQKRVVADLERQYTAAKAAFDKVNMGTQNPQQIAERERASKLFREIRAELGGEKQALVELEKELNKQSTAQGRATNSAASYMTQLRHLRNEMQTMRMAGQQETQRYRELQAELTRVGTAYNLVRREQRLLTTAGNANLAGVMAGMSGIAGAFSAGQGVASLFVKNSERLAEIQTKLQAAMSITMGLQAVSNTLHATSAFRIQTVAKVTGLWQSAVRLLNVQLGLSVGLSKALLISGIGAIVVGIAAAVTAFNRYREAQEKALRSQKQLTEINIKAAKSIAEVTTDFERYNRIVKDSAATDGDKEKALKELNKKYGDTFGKVKNVKDMEEQLISRAPAYIAMMAEKAKAQAAMALAVEGQEKLLKSLAKSDKDVLRERFDGSYIPTFLTDIVQFKGKSDEEIKQQAETRRSALIAQAQWDSKTYYDAMTDAEHKATEIAEKNGFKETKDPKPPGKSKEETEAERRRKEASAARKKLAEHAVSDENKYNALVIAAMEEGAEKRIAEINAGYDKEIDAIEKKLKEIDELESKARRDGNFTEKDKKNTDAARQSLTDSKTAAGQKRDVGIQNVLKDSKKEIQSMWDGIYDNMRSSLQKELVEIERSYDEKKNIIIKNTLDATDREVQLRELAANKQREINVATINDERSRLSVRKDIETEKQKLANKTYLFEADKAEALLKIEKKAAEEELALLEKLRAEGVQGLGDEIELLIEKIKAMNSELEKMPANKFSEGIGFLKSFSEGMSGLSGEIGSIFGEVSEGIGNIQTAFSDSASAQDKFSAGLNGIISIVNMLSAASQQRKRVEKEFYQNAIAFAHEYALALNEQLRMQSEVNGSGFITDYAGKISDSFAAMNEATDKYYESISKLGDGKVKIKLRDSVDWGAVGKGAVGGAAAGAVIGSVVPVIGNAIGAAVGGLIGGIAGFFGGKKKKNEYGGLLDIFPELVDSAGNLNKELAQTLINTKQTDDETAQLLQNAIEWADAVEEANKQVREIVVDLSGSLGNDLKTAIVDAWKAGEDASKSMFDAANKSLEGFIENLLYSVIFADLFKDFEDRLVESLAPGGDGNIIDDYAWFIGEMDKRDEAYTSQLGALKEYAKGKGFNLWEPDNSQEAKKGLFQTMSQDTGTDLLGQFVAFRIHTADIHGLMVNMEKENKIVTSHLAAIEKNTSDTVSELKEVNTRLKRFENEGLRMK